MLREGARHGDRPCHGPGKARHWLPPSRCAAEMRRKTTLGASPHLPSSPRPRPRRLFHLPAPAALSSPPGGASRCPHRSRHRHLARRCQDQMAGHLAGPARPSLLGRPSLLARRTGHLCHLCSHRQSAQDSQNLAAPTCLQRNQGTGILSSFPCK